MKDEMLTISKHDLIEILTKSDIFNSEGIEIVLSRDGLKGILSGMMVTIDSSSSRADHYKDECSRLRDTIRDLESLVDKYEEMNKGEVNSRLNIGKDTDQAKKVYNIISITYDLFEVILYENGIEVDEYTVYPENLDKLIEKIEADGYEYEDCVHK